MGVVSGNDDGLEALLLPSAHVLQILMEGEVGGEKTVKVNLTGPHAEVSL